MVKFLLDFVPLIAFFLAYKVEQSFMQPAVFATVALTVAVVLSMIISRILKVKMEKIALYSNIAVIIFGLLTVAFNNPVFIKAKLTVINLIFGIILLFFYYKDKPIIKSVFHGKIEMDDDKWNALNLRFAIMFFLISLLNLAVWQFASEEAWVNFKTFGVLPFMLLFFLIQMRFIIKNGVVLSK